MGKVVRVVSKGIAFRSDEYSASRDINTIKIKFTEELISNIKKAMALIEGNPFIDSISIPCGDVQYLTEEGEEHTEWRVDVHKFVVYDHGIYYYAQNKWHSGDQIESNCINLNEIE